MYAAVTRGAHMSADEQQLDAVGDLVKRLQVLRPARQVDYLIAAGSLLRSSGAFERSPGSTDLARVLAGYGWRRDPRWITLALHAADLAEHHGAVLVSGLPIQILRTLAPLPEPGRGELLARIHCEGIPLAAIRAAAKQLRAASGRRSGRPELPTYQKSFRALGRLVRDVRGRLREVERCATRCESETVVLRHLAVQLIELGEELRLRLRPGRANPREVS